MAALKTGGDDLPPSFESSLDDLLRPHCSEHMVEVSNVQKLKVRYSITAIQVKVLAEYINT